LWEPVRKSTEILWGHAEPQRVLRGRDRKKGDSSEERND